MAASRGRSAIASGTGCVRRGPTVADGEQRSLHTGSVSTQWPPISSSVVAWPSQVTASSAACAGSSGRTSGTGRVGRPLPSRRAMSRAIEPVCSTTVIGSRLANRPSRQGAVRTAGGSTVTVRAPSERRRLRAKPATGATRPTATSGMTRGRRRRTPPVFQPAG